MSLIDYIDTEKTTIAILRDWNDQHWKFDFSKGKIQELESRLASTISRTDKVLVSDGTLAMYNGWVDSCTIGPPIYAMVNRVQQWLYQGKRVKIFTARACQIQPDREKVIQAIEDWTEKYIGQRLEVTAEKDWLMLEFWDDRCKEVIPNTGVPKHY